MLWRAQFDDCLLINFHETSPFTHWRVLYNFCRSKEPCPRFDAQAHAGLIDELKLLYVAVTRARKRLVFLDIDSNKWPFVRLCQDDDLIEQGPIDELFTQLEGGKTSPAEWEAKGRELFDMKNFREARKAFRYAGASEWEKAADAHMLMSDNKKAQAALIFEELMLWLDHAHCLEQLENYKGAAQSYLRHGDADDGMFTITDPPSQRERYESFRNAARCFERAGMVREALEQFDRVCAWSDVLRICSQRAFASYCEHALHVLERNPSAAPPDHADSLNVLAAAHFWGLKKRDQAIAHIKRVHDSELRHGLMRRYKFWRELTHDCQQMCEHQASAKILEDELKDYLAAAVDYLLAAKEADAARTLLDHLRERPKRFDDRFDKAFCEVIEMVAANSAAELELEKLRCFSVSRVKLLALYDKYADRLPGGDRVRMAITLDIFSTAMTAKRGSDFVALLQDVERCVESSAEQILDRDQIKLQPGLARLRSNKLDLGFNLRVYRVQSKVAHRTDQTTREFRRSLVTTLSQGAELCPSDDMILGFQIIGDVVRDEVHDTLGREKTSAELWRDELPRLAQLDRTRRSARLLDVWAPEVTILEPAEIEKATQRLGQLCELDAVSCYDIVESAHLAQLLGEPAGMPKQEKMVRRAVKAARAIQAKYAPFAVARGMVRNVVEAVIMRLPDKCEAAAKVGPGAGKGFSNGFLSAPAKQKGKTKAKKGRASKATITTTANEPATAGFATGLAAMATARMPSLLPAQPKVAPALITHEPAPDNDKGVGKLPPPPKDQSKAIPVQTANEPAQAKGAKKKKNNRRGGKGGGGAAATAAAEKNPSASDDGHRSDGGAVTAAGATAGAFPPPPRDEDCGSSRRDGGGGASPGDGGNGELCAFLASIGLEHTMPSFTTEEVRRFERRPAENERVSNCITVAHR